MAYTRPVAATAMGGTWPWPASTCTQWQGQIQPAVPEGMDIILKQPYNFC